MQTEQNNHGSKHTVQYYTHDLEAWKPDDSLKNNNNNKRLFVCLFGSDPDGADVPTEPTLCWNLAHRIINSQHRAGSHAARWSLPSNSKQCFYMRSHASSFQGGERRSPHAEPSLSLFCQTRAVADPGKSICHWMTSNAAAFYIYEATKDLQLRPCVLHLWAPRRRWIAWSKVSIERAWKQRWYQFPPGCWLPQCLV